jgi:hypothetical protein
MWINECLFLYLPFIPSPTLLDTLHTSSFTDWTLSKTHKIHKWNILLVSLPQNILNSHVLLILIQSQIAPPISPCTSVVPYNLTAVTTTLTLVTTQDNLHVNKRNLPRHKILTPMKHNSNWKSGNKTFNTWINSSSSF